jgi:hypothetical protein
MKLLSPTAKNPYKHIPAANALIIEMADAGQNTDAIGERVYFLTEGYAEKDHRHPGTRLADILAHSP